MIVSYEIPRQCTAMYYPEANPLVPLRHVAHDSNQLATKSVVITLTASPASTEVNRVTGCMYAR